jgi:deoxyribose-phosphate aldolase
MDQTAAAGPPPLTTYEGLARMLDHSLLRPDLTAEAVTQGCLMARDYRIAAVVVRPGDIDLARPILEGTGVAICGAAGFPHGSSTTATKLYETRDMLRRGATEIDAVISIGKLRSRQFQAVETELQQLSDACHENGALLKVIFENAYLAEDLKIIACRICSRVRADFLVTSTGFAPSGYTLDDVRLMRKHSNPTVQIKGSGGLRSLEQALELYEAGCARLGTTQTAAILDSWKARLKEMEKAAEPDAKSARPAT